MGKFDGDERVLANVQSVFDHGKAEKRKEKGKRNKVAKAGGNGRYSFYAVLHMEDLIGGSVIHSGSYVFDTN